MQKEKIRVYSLARELDMESKDLLDLCRQAGIDVKNQLSSLDPEQRDVVVELVKRGGNVAVSAPPRPAAPVLASPSQPMRNLTSPRPQPPRPLKPEPPQPAPPPPAAPLAPTAPVIETPAVEVGGAPPAPAAPPAVPALAAEAAQAAQLAPEPVTPEPAPPTMTPAPPIVPAAAAAAAPPVELGGAAPRVADMGARMRNLGPAKPGEQQRAKRIRPAPRPVIATIAKPPTPKPQKPVEDKKLQQPAAQKPTQYLPEDMAKGKIPVNLKELSKPAKGAVPAAPAVVTEEDEDADQKGKRPAAAGAGVVGRDKRHQQRADRARQRKGREGELLTARNLLQEDERPRHVKDRLQKLKKKREPTQPRNDPKVPIALPITVRSLSEALGVRAPDLLFKLKDHGVATALTINSTLEPVVAETVALDYGRELDIKRQHSAEDEMLAVAQQPDNPDDLVPRAPIVTIMGHVDHGKTSLLDRIRKSNVVATEAGGITQVIRAWRVEQNGKPITFLDTPGHEAFTKMRARGANVTDIAVIVCAADDGVMPQTEEAIAHARAAGVSLVVAINKVDLPNANLNKTRQQLYSLNVLPDNMGGDTPFVETSAATGKGIDELLEQLSVVAELKELKANPNKPARGTCLEAMLDEGEGVLATLLVQEGTLRKGDVILCGASYGRVRTLYNDLGQPIQEAGPSMPARLMGLDEVPDADDPFQVVDDLAVAREIAGKRKERRQEASLTRREPARLEDIAQLKIVELKVILKADFRGSIEAIKKELEKLHHAEVRVRVLEAAIGGITENDVWLALTSPQDTLIVGFNAVPDDRARALAEERGVQIRLYNIIYNLTDDIRSALEGKLKPREEVIHLGRAVVRETFKITRVGTIAGCYVTQGTIERSAKVRLIRDGVVIYPPADRTASLESLKRFKEDVREVREGFECGLKIAGYDDVKVGDVVEAYRIEQVQRTLEK